MTWECVYSWQVCYNAASACDVIFIVLNFKFFIIFNYFSTVFAWFNAIIIFIIIIDAESVVNDFFFDFDFFKFSRIAIVQLDVIFDILAKADGLNPTGRRNLGTFFINQLTAIFSNSEGIDIVIDSKLSDDFNPNSKLFFSEVAH